MLTIFFAALIINAAAFPVNEPQNLFAANPLISPQEQEKPDLEGEASQLFKSAKKQFKDEKYWSCAVDLIVLLDFYPDFSKIDQVIYWLGNCLYEMQMYDGADRIYRFLLRSGLTTPWIPESILGLQKVHYQKQDHLQSLKFYKALESHYSSFTGISAARYYAEQSYFQLKNYGLVHNVAQQIEKKSEFYPFGLYTSGLAHLKKKASRKP